MTVKQNVRRLLWPTALMALCLGLVIIPAGFADLPRHSETLTFSLRALAYFAAAWLVGRVIALALDKAAARRRPFPRLLLDLIAALMFLIAFAATVSLFMGQGTAGALAGSGIILAMLGIAIRNVVADTLSGVALGVEAPFRI